MTSQGFREKEEIIKHKYLKLRQVKVTMTDKLSPLILLELSW